MPIWNISARKASARNARTFPFSPSGATWRNSSPRTRRAPRVEPREGPALRCRDLAIGYPERQIASDVQLEIDHGTRAAVVGDNGQGKTTFLRTVVDSLKPLGGEARWGFGCKVGVYAQHVYTSLPE